MGLVEAIVLGIVQGLTEFLPISSTAHIRIVPSLVGWPDPGAAFTAVIQLGTIVAVIVYFWSDLCRFFLGWLAGMRDPHRRSSLEWRMGWAIVVGTIPIAIFGLLFKDSIEGSLRSLYVIAIALIALGLLMMVAEIVGRRDRSLEGVRLRDGLWVGFWQALALIPGASRSGTTITGGLFAGLDRPTAPDSRSCCRCLRSCSRRSSTWQSTGTCFSPATRNSWRLRSWPRSPPSSAGMPRSPSSFDSCKSTARGFLSPTGSCLGV